MISFRQTYDKSQLLQYNAVKKRWYTTSQRQKYWVADDQIDSILSALWNAVPKNETDCPLVKLLSIQSVAQCFDLTGTRSLSLLDDFARPKGEVGRYLRWQMLKVRLVGYDDHQEPQFVVSASASGSKFARKDGDKLSVDFSVGSLSCDTKASQRDLALALVTLAAFTNAMGPNLPRAIMDKSYGDGLLKQSSNGYHEFSALPAFSDTPVFINHHCLHEKHKHETDESPYNAHATPLNNRSFNRLMRASCDAAGYSEVATTSTFRGTWSTKARLFTNMKDAEIAAGMYHLSGNKSLSRFVYYPTHAPVDSANSRLGESSLSTSVKDAVGNVNKLPQRPDRSRLSEGQLSRLRHIMKSHENGKESNEEAVVEAFAEVNAGQTASFDDSVSGILRLLRNDECATIWTANNHPFVRLCDNKPSKILKYLQEGGPYACPSCRKERHGEAKVSNRKHWKLLNECYSKTHGKFVCSLCGTVEDEDKCVPHFQACFKLHLEKVGNTAITFDDFCKHTTFSIPNWCKIDVFVWTKRCDLTALWSHTNICAKSV